MSDRKPPVWPWVVVVLVGLPLLYVASFGPACWLVGRNEFLARHTSTAYRPLVRLACTDRGNSGTALRWFARFSEQGESGLIRLGLRAGMLELEDGTSSTIRFHGGLPD